MHIGNKVVANRVLVDKELNPYYIKNVPLTDVSYVRQELYPKKGGGTTAYKYFIADAHDVSKTHSVHCYAQNVDVYGDPEKLYEDLAKADWRTEHILPTDLEFKYHLNMRRGVVGRKIPYSGFALDKMYNRLVHNRETVRHLDVINQIKIRLIGLEEKHCEW